MIWVKEEFAVFSTCYYLVDKQSEIYVLADLASAGFKWKNYRKALSIVQKIGILKISYIGHSESLSSNVFQWMFLMLQR